MQQQVSTFANEYQMLPKGSTVLCALSGGADSMCLIHLLNQMGEAGGFTVIAAHYDHRLRGEESAFDAAFVAEWCVVHGIRCVIGEGDVRREADLQGQGIEETARQMRYSFLRRTADTVGATRIATAHHADDNVETLLLHLVRGSGLQGMTGIPPRRGQIVRPLLTTTRAQIMDYLEQHKIPHREDSSNSDDAYTRNRIRHQIIPVLRSINPKFIQGVTETMGYLRDDNDYLNGKATEVCQKARWSGDDLVIEAALVANLPPAIAPRVVRRLLELMGDGEVVNCTSAHLTSMVNLCQGDDPSGVVHLPGGRIAQRVYEDLMLTTRQNIAPPLSPTPVALDGETYVGTRGWRVRCRPVRCPMETERPMGVFYLARDKVQGGLVLRSRIQGDEITLPGRKRKTVKKLFIDEKVPRREREQIPILVDSLGVIAVAGSGPDKNRLATEGEPAYAITFRQD